MMELKGTEYTQQQYFPMVIILNSSQQQVEYFQNSYQEKKSNEALPPLPSSSVKINVHGANKCEYELFPTKTKTRYEILVSLQLVMIGSKINKTFNGTTYEIDIQKGELEGTEIELDKNTIGIVKYEQNCFFSRVGDDLVGRFQYSKAYENETVPLTTLIRIQENLTIKLRNTTERFVGMGFYNPKTRHTGDYIVQIYLQ